MPQQQQQLPAQQQQLQPTLGLAEQAQLLQLV
jgi:hypothetical protein